MKLHSAESGRTHCFLSTPDQVSWAHLLDNTCEVSTASAPPPDRRVRTSRAEAGSTADAPMNVLLTPSTPSDTRTGDGLNRAPLI